MLSPIQSLRTLALDPTTELHTLIPLYNDAHLRVQLSYNGIQFIAFRQLRYLRDYVVRHREFDSLDYGQARSILIEDHYIDHDFMEDYSDFYARSFRAPVNACSRIHFFSLPPDELRRKLTDLCGRFRSAAGEQLQIAHGEVARFSAQHYLGFAVLRPLVGVPVGRTVLRALPEININDQYSRRVIPNVQRYTTHVTGLDLSVEGLPFQQQDICISACATVALWCALHRSARVDDLRVPSPVEITRFATQYRLPFGRAVPTSGLDVDQMCGALQCAGVSPYLTRVTSLLQGRALLHAATRSGLASILIMRRGTNEHHAVTVVGMKVGRDHQVSPIGIGKYRADDLSGDVQAFYVHDDRIGPYRRVEIDATVEDQFKVRIPKQSHLPPAATREYEIWVVEQVLIPLYPKIRFGLGDLFHCAYDHLVPNANHTLNEIGEIDNDDAIRVQYQLHRGHDYLAKLNREAAVSSETQNELFTTLAVPRYLAAISLSSPRWGQVDALLDTTSARTDLNWLGIIVMESGTHIAMVIADRLRELLACPVFGYD